MNIFLEDQTIFFFKKVLKPFPDHDASFFKTIFIQQFTMHNDTMDFSIRREYNCKLLPNVGIEFKFN